MGGQAKKRGTYEERVQQAIERKERERLERIEADRKRQIAEAEAFNALSEEEKEKIIAAEKRAANNRTQLAMIMATMLGGSYPSMSYDKELMKLIK